MDSTMKLRITFILLALFSLYFYGIKETFVGDSSLDPEDYSESESKPKLLLNDWYPSYKPFPKLSEISMDEQYTNYPVFPAKSTKINNIKEWRRPNNGKCQPPNLCGNFYDAREVTLPTPAKMPGFTNAIRVNFYDSKQ